MLENSLSKRRAPRTKVDIEGYYNIQRPVGSLYDLRPQRNGSRDET
jgi:hypothetical protein